MERENIIELVKALGITAEELGIKPEIKTITEKDEQLFHEVSEMIHETEMDLELVRDYINEKYWDDLGIRPEKRYKVIKVTLEKTVYKDIKVAIPEDTDEDDVMYYVDGLHNLDTDYPDDEEDWEFSGSDIADDNITAKEIDDKYGSELWNYDDYED